MLVFALFSHTKAGSCDDCVTAALEVLIPAAAPPSSVYVLSRASVFAALSSLPQHKTTNNWPHRGVRSLRLPSPLLPM